MNEDLLDSLFGAIVIVMMGCSVTSMLIDNHLNAIIFASWTGIMIQIKHW